MIAYGQPLADHATIGSAATLQAAHQDSVRAFHARWYRPENAAIIVSGDADPRLMAALIQKWFGDWHPEGKHTPAPISVSPPPPSVAIRPTRSPMPACWSSPRRPRAADGGAAPMA
jgi:zinc protease